jgi:hypothetical protein
MSLFWQEVEALTCRIVQDVEALTCRIVIVLAGGSALACKIVIVLALT